MDSLLDSATTGATGLSQSNLIAYISFWIVPITATVTGILLTLILKRRSVKVIFELWRTDPVHGEIWRIRIRPGRSYVELVDAGFILSDRTRLQPTEINSMKVIDKRSTERDVSELPKKPYKIEAGCRYAFNIFWRRLAYAFHEKGKHGKSRIRAYAVISSKDILFKSKPQSIQIEREPNSDKRDKET